jgi:hypothetical protein
MQVIPPSEFARIVFGASSGRNYRPHLPHQPVFRQPQGMSPFFHVPTIRHPSQSVTIDGVSQKIKGLERDVRRLTEELKIRTEISRRERMVRDALKGECEELRDEVSRLRSVLHAREREIYDLERQLRANQNQLLLLRRRYEEASAAVTRKPSPTPGSISSLPKELRSIGTQVDEINDLEERIERLTATLVVEKERNRRIKSLLVTEPHCSVPPLPSDDGRSRSVPPIQRRPLSTQCPGGRIVIPRPQPPIFTQQVFLELNAIPAPPPAPPIELSPPPLLLSPIKKENPSEFHVFEDKENHANRRTRGSPHQQRRPAVLLNSSKLERANVVPDVEVSPFRKPASSSSLQPPPFVPQLNLGALRPTAAQPREDSSARSVQSTSSEAAIKRAVAAAIEKRKQLASQGVGIGSARSSILGSSSFMTNSPINISGVKARFCLPLG